VKDLKLFILAIIAICLISVLVVYVQVNITGQVWVDVGGRYVQGSAGEGLLNVNYYRGSPQSVLEMYGHTYEDTPSSSYITEGEIPTSSHSNLNPVQNQVIIGTTEPSWIRERPHE